MEVYPFPALCNTLAEMMIKAPLAKMIRSTHALSSNPLATCPREAES